MFKSDTRMNNSAKLDIKCFRRFWRIRGIIFPGFPLTNLLMFITLLLLALFEELIIYQVGVVPSRFYEALENKDLTSFKEVALLSFFYIALNSFLKSGDSYLSKLLDISWRKCLTESLHTSYFRGKAYYQLSSMQEVIDNPDQRISQDVKKFCSQLSQMASKVVVSPFTLTYYTYQCFISTSWQGPVSLFVYFIIGTCINKLLMSPVVSAVVAQDKLEGNFRFKHMQIRVHAESVAFYRAGTMEHRSTNRHLQSLLQMQRHVVNREFWLKLFMNTFDYMGSIFSYIAIAIPIFSGLYDDLSPAQLGALVSKNGFVCIYLINCFSQLIDLSREVSDVAAYTHRIGELQEMLQKFSEEQAAQSIGENFESSWDLESSLDGGSELVPEAFSVVLVSFSVPGTDDDPLLEDLSLRLIEDHNILVTGNTGSGKTSLLRVLAGLWPTLQGKVFMFSCFGPRGIMFLPQKPYFTDGTLRNQVTFPLPEIFPVTEHDDERIIRFLKYVGLSCLLGRTGGLDEPVEWSWYNVLSPGEMQRLTFARLFYHQPKFVVMDESTSALTEETESEMYRMCGHLGITVLSVGHRSSLNKHHDCVLRLKGKRSWEFKQLHA
uniref:ATP-binding cassette, sub-family D (ALD), member 4 n=1 Tax=Eptatretus burgeri TaxID=7764 RepID=A0A8C4Q2G4_EPTBU